MKQKFQDPMLPYGTDRCQCTACLLYFSSTYAFDQHRRGRSHERRCLTVAEMENAGWTKRASGHWLSPSKGYFTDTPAAV